MSGPRIDIAFCIDEGMVAPALVAISSIVEHADRAVRIFVVTSGAAAPLAEAAASLRRPDVEIVVEAIDNPFARFPRNSYISAATYLRFLLPDLLDVDKVLYLDADLIATRCLGPLFDTDIAAFPVAAVPDYAMSLGSLFQLGWSLWYDDAPHDFARYINKVVGLRGRGDARYFNAGVMLLNLRNWRETDFVAKVLAFLQSHPGLSFLDQDGLNHVCGGRYCQLDGRWNSVVGATATRPTRWVDRVLPRSRRWATICSMWLDDAWIIHFAGATKPWNARGAAMPMAGLWHAYAARSPAAAMFGGRSADH